MLNYVEIFQKYGQPNGVIHCGCQLFHIRKLYLAYGLFNTIWIEPQQFFYEYGLNLINGTDERLYDYQLTSENTLSKLFTQQNLNIENYNYIHLSLPIYIIGGLNIFNSNIDNFKYISIEVTQNIQHEHTDLSIVKEWFEKRRYKLIERKSVDNVGQLFFVKKRKYTKK